MHDIWKIVAWWDDWQLRVLVMGSLGFQWFLLLAAPMRKYSVPRAFRTCIWLAYISSDALAIYALATLFNRHARTVPASNCAPGREQARILEVLWAPVLLIHLGGQEELTAYEIEDNELWTRYTVTLVSQVAVAIYAFCKSWPTNSDGKLTAAAVLLFIIGVISFSEKPLALNRAKIKRLAAVSAWIQGTKKPSLWRQRLDQFFLFEDFTLLPRLSLGGEKGRRRQVALLEADKVLMVLSDMSLRAAAKDLVARNKAKKEEEVLPPLTIAEKALPRWLRGAFAFIYTRASVVVTPLYMFYHLLVVPVLHIAALTLFATSDKHKYKRADVKITYIILCLTAALDLLAVFIRQLLYWLMAKTQVPALCETVPGYILIDEALQEADRSVGWMYRCARKLGLTYFVCRPRQDGPKEIAATLLADLVDARDRDLASYRVFDSAATVTKNWALNKELQKKCIGEIRKCLTAVSFDRSVLLWHIATDLCFRCMDVVGDQQEEEEEEEEAQPQEEEEGGGGEGGGYNDQQAGESAAAGEGIPPQGPVRMDPTLRLHIKCTQAISNYMAHLLNVNPDMLLTGSRHHLITEARNEVKSSFPGSSDDFICTCCSCSCTGTTCSCTGSSCARTQSLNRGEHLDNRKNAWKQLISGIAGQTTTHYFHIVTACKLANELLQIQDDATRWKLMYRVWLGMLCYSASMCRGYLHAKSLGEGGEFLSLIWLVLSLKGAKTLADRLQMPPEAQATDDNQAPKQNSRQQDKAESATHQ